MLKSFRLRRLAQSLSRGFEAQHFPINFRIKWLFWNVRWLAFRSGSHKVYVSAFWDQSGARHFSCKFPYQVALVKCWLAFRLRRLVQGLRRGFGAQHFSCKFPYDVALVKCYLACSTPWARTKCVSAFWAQSGARHFSCKFPYQVALVKCWLAFRLRRLVQGLRRGFGAQHFSCKFPYDVALVKCYLAFRLRGLARSLCLRSGLNQGHGIFLANFCIKWLLWNVDLHFDCAGSYKACAAVLGRSIFPVNFRMMWLLWNATLHFDSVGSHEVCVCVLGSIRGTAFFL